MQNDKSEIIDESQLDDELIELEFDEDSVEYYIVDKDDNEIGVCLNENGKKVEYLYDDSYKKDNNLQSDLDLQVKATAQSIKDVKHELGLASDDVKEVAQELQNAADEIKGLLDDVKSSISIFPKKKK